MSLKTTGIIMGIVVGGVVILGGMKVFSMVTNTAVGVAERTLDPDNVLYNYEWFKRQYHDVWAMDQKIFNAQVSLSQFREGAGPRENWTFEDKQMDNRLQTIVLGLQNQKKAMIAEYNARSQAANRSIFKTGDLPESL